MAIERRSDGRSGRHRLHGVGAGPQERPGPGPPRCRGHEIGRQGSELDHLVRGHRPSARSLLPHDMWMGLPGHRRVDFRGPRWPLVRDLNAPITDNGPPFIWYKTSANGGMTWSSRTML